MCNEPPYFMMKLYLFNPESDLALANFTAHYMAPALIQRMAADLAFLPVWYAEPGSGVVAPSAYHADYLEQMRQLFGLRVQLVTPPELAVLEQPQLLPWGWNPALRRRLLAHGLAESVLPSLQQLHDYRRLAGRQVSLQVLESLTDLPNCCGEGVLLTTVDACEAYWKRQHQRCVFKAPWSGSGKGLLWCYSDFTAAVAAWCNRVIGEQGMLVGMPLYNKVLDFAMEYRTDGRGGIDFLGYSLFDTNAKGAYSGNRLWSDLAIEQQLAAYVPLASVHGIRQQLTESLLHFFPGYAGCMGVDMMVCRTNNDSYAVLPCVEVNLRMNMGIVARCFYDRYVDPRSRGTFHVEALPSTEQLVQAHRADETAAPLQVSDGKLVSGYLSFVPITPQSRYRVYVKVHRFS